MSCWLLVERSLEGLNPSTGKFPSRWGQRVGGLWGPQGILGGGLSESGRQACGLTSEPQKLASVQNHSWGRQGAKHGGERREAVTGGAGQEGCDQRSHVLLSGLAEHTHPGTLPHAL